MMAIFQNLFRTAGEMSRRTSNGVATNYLMYFANKKWTVHTKNKETNTYFWTIELLVTRTKIDLVLEVSHLMICIMLGMKLLKHSSPDHQQWLKKDELLHTWSLSHSELKLAIKFWEILAAFNVFSPIATGLWVGSYLSCSSHVALGLSAGLDYSSAGCFSSGPNVLCLRGFFFCLLCLRGMFVDFLTERVEPAVWPIVWSSLRKKYWLISNVCSLFTQLHFIF